MYVSNVSRDNREQFPLILPAWKDMGALDGPMERDSIARLRVSTKKRKDNKLDEEFP